MNNNYRHNIVTLVAHFHDIRNYMPQEVELTEEMHGCIRLKPGDTPFKVVVKSKNYPNGPVIR